MWLLLLKSLRDYLTASAAFADVDVHIGQATLPKYPSIEMGPDQTQAESLYFKGRGIVNLWIELNVAIVPNDPEATYEALSALEGLLRAALIDWAENVVDGDVDADCVPISIPLGVFDDSMAGATFWTAWQLKIEWNKLGH